MALSPCRSRWYCRDEWTGKRQGTMASGQQSEGSDAAPRMAGNELPGMLSG